MKILLVLASAFILCGCVAPLRVKHNNTQMWLLCYQDDKILPNGMYASEELRIRCNGRRFFQFRTKFGGPEKSDPLDLKKKLNEYGTN